MDSHSSSILCFLNWIGGIALACKKTTREICTDLNIYTAW